MVGDAVGAVVGTLAHTSVANSVLETHAINDVLSIVVDLQERQIAQGWCGVRLHVDVCL